MTSEKIGLFKQTSEKSSLNFSTSSFLHAAKISKTLQLFSVYAHFEQQLWTQLKRVVTPFMQEI